MIIAQEKDSIGNDLSIDEGEGVEIGVTNTSQSFHHVKLKF